MTDQTVASSPTNTTPANSQGAGIPVPEPNRQTGGGSDRATSTHHQPANDGNGPPGALFLVPKFLFFFLNASIYVSQAFIGRYLRKRLNISPEQYGMLMGLNVFSAVGSNFWSLRADRSRSHKKILMFTVPAFAAIYTLIAIDLDQYAFFRRNSWAVFIYLCSVFALYVFMSSASFPITNHAVNAIMAQAGVTNKDLFGRQRLFGTLGHSFGTVSSEFMQNMCKSWGWEWLGEKIMFFLMPLYAIVFTLLVFFGVPSDLTIPEHMRHGKHKKGAENDHGKDTTVKNPILHLLKRASFLMLLGAVLVVGYLRTAVQTFQGYLVQRDEVETPRDVKHFWTYLPVYSFAKPNETSLQQVEKFHIDQFVASRAKKHSAVVLQARLEKLIEQEKGTSDANFWAKFSLDDAKFEALKNYKKEQTESIEQHYSKYETRLEEWNKMSRRQRLENPKQSSPEKPKVEIKADNANVGVLLKIKDQLEKFMKDEALSGKEISKVGAFQAQNVNGLNLEIEAKAIQDELNEVQKLKIERDSKVIDQAFINAQLAFEAGLKQTKPWTTYSALTKLLSEIMIWYFQKQFMQWLGVYWLLLISLLASATRAFGYGFMNEDNVAFAIMWEFLKGVSTGMFFVATVSIAVSNAPKGFESTCQSLLDSTYTGIGALVAGFLAPALIYFHKKNRLARLYMLFERSGMMKEAEGIWNNDDNSLRFMFLVSGALGFLFFFIFFAKFALVDKVLFKKKQEEGRKDAAARV